MTLEEMKTALKRYGFDDTDPLAMWLNAAMHDMESDFDWPWLESELVTKNTEAGKPKLATPFSIIKVISIRDKTNQRKLQFYDQHRFFREIADPLEQGQPELYTLQGIEAFVHLWPIPSAVYEMEMIVQTLTGDLVNPADEPKAGTYFWPAISHYSIIMKAAAIALQAENEEERAKNALDQYDKSLERLRRKFGERELDEPTTVQDVQGYSDTMAGYGRKGY